jgi:hypothetical protein
MRRLFVAVALLLSLVLSTQAFGQRETSSRTGASGSPFRMNPGLTKRSAKIRAPDFPVAMSDSCPEWKRS